MGEEPGGLPFQIPGLPRDWLTPYVLLVLKEWETHGYDLMQRLMQMGFSGFDQSYLYRLLRQLEEQGVIRSVWDTETKGPARRVYSLTDLGSTMLQSWAGAMNLYRQQLDLFFRMYGMMPPAAPPDKEDE
jgi:PadR family transcriptional regulator, regulatory protein PadR